MSHNKDSYKQTFKNTSILGGVQLFNVFITIIKSKFIAIFLGPSGMGIMGLLTSTLGLITSFTNFGLGSSAVKNIAQASTNNKEKLGQVVMIFKRLVWLTGSLGFLLTLILSPWLSKIAFNNDFYVLSFAFISITLLINQISSGQNTLMQGMREIKLLVKSNLSGTSLGLLTSVPLFYFLKEKGIVPAIILTSVSTLFASWFYSDKIKIPSANIERITFRIEATDMLKMGFLISMTGLITAFSSYIVRVFISKVGSLTDVGLYAAGFAIIGSYAGMVFTAMGTDYYPRLTAVSNNNEKCNQEINQQAEIAILILAPFLMALLIFIKWGILILYSDQFLEILTMIRWSVFGTFFQALSWCIAYVFLAKGASKAYFWNDVIANGYMIILNITGYYYFGLTGLGISYFFSYFLYFVQMFFVSKKLYNFHLFRDTIRIFSVQLLIAIGCITCITYTGKIYGLLIGSLLIILSGFYSWKELNNKILLKEIILQKIGIHTKK